MELLLMVHRILLAEDDVRLASLVKDYLESTGEYAVTVETNGGKVQRTVTDVLPELLILDVMLPNKDGLSICREIRPNFPGPILMLTARNDDADQILGLECGADDYVIKPAEPRVLLARIRALLRRYSLEEKSDKENLQYGDLNICCLSRSVTFAGEPVDLSSHEFDLLLTFARQPGQTMSREFLFNTIYSRPYDGLDRTIDVRISQLRKKLGDNAEKPFRIKTIWGRGYMFVEDAWKAG
jgi:DNA-binding response OmpR family regulator